MKIMKQNLNRKLGKFIRPLFLISYFRGAQSSWELHSKTEKYYILKEK